MSEVTEEEMKEYMDRLLAKLKQDPQYEIRQELGKLLMKHIDDLTDKERERYEELLILIK